MESYRVEKRAAEQVQLDEAEARLKPKSEDVPNKVSYSEQEYLSQVVREFNERFGTKWTEDDRIRNFLFDDLPDTIAGDEEFVRRIRSSDRQNARITVEERVVDEFQDLIMTHTDLYKKFTDDPEFKSFVHSMIFQHVYEEASTE
jgi:type I restriction enzyme R subunit